MTAWRRVAPGLANILANDAAGWRGDIAAGIAVATVGLPAAIAFAGLMGLPPEAGLHASILPLVAYAVFGASRRLIVGADTATCVLVASSLTAMGVVDPDERWAYAQLLAMISGVFCLGAGLLRLGAVADFLSQPILVGFLNGVALDLALGQAPRLLGLPAFETETFPRIVALAQAMGQAHGPTALVSLATLGFVLAVRRLLPRWPAALLACLAVGGASFLWNLPALGVQVLGSVPADLPGFALPELHYVPLAARRYALVQYAAGIALISFASSIISARAFADRHGETVDADAEAAGLGISNLVAGLAQGFPVSGTSSRTAVAEAAGAASPAAALVAALGIAVMMAFLTRPLAWLPRGAMAALLVQAALSLLDIGAIRRLWRMDRGEAGVALVAMAGVLVAGPLNAVLVSAALAITRFIRITARPGAEVLGRVAGLPGFHGRALHPDAQFLPGMLFFRFNAPIVFFNAPAFQRAALAAVEEAGPDLAWFVLDLQPVTQMDATGFQALRRVRKKLAARGVHMVFAGRRAEALAWLARRGLDQPRFAKLLFPTLNAARHAFAAERGGTGTGSAGKPRGKGLRKAGARSAP